MANEKADAVENNAVKAEGLLRRARKLAGPSFDDQPAETSFLLAQARVRAVLEMAAAVREAEA
jgi:hypothetical protein